MRSGVITVCIVEDDHRVRDNLAALIDGAPSLRCLGAFASAEQALESIPLRKPDVILMDIHVMLTAYEVEDFVFQAHKVGACGYLLKQTPPGELLAAIVDAHQGGGPMSSNIARKVIRSFHESERNTSLTEHLTAREREILDYLAKGYQYKEIADMLSLSYTTVNTHIKTIYGKLHVRSRFEAVTKYFRS